MTTKQKHAFFHLCCLYFFWSASCSIARNSNIKFSDQVRDLGVIFDSDLSLKQHVIKTSQAAYMEMRRISTIRHYVTYDATKILINAFILSKLDYCNSLLAGYPQSLLKPLQQVRNSAAKLSSKARKSQHPFWKNSTGFPFSNAWNTNPLVCVTVL